MQSPSEHLALGQLIELGVGGEWFPTRVQDDTRLTVGWPTDRDRRLVPFEPGQIIQVMVAARQDALYAAVATVEVADRGDVPLLTLRLTGRWERIQRRAAVREKVAVRPRLAHVVYGEAKRSLRLGVINVSATGVQVRSQDEIRHGDLLELAFELDGEVEVTARVRRVRRGERVWDAGCEFEGISDSLAQRIVQFIFAQQRAMLRMRRGNA